MENNGKVIGTIKLAELLADKFVECIIGFNNGTWQPRIKGSPRVNFLKFQNGKEIGTAGFIKSVALEINIYLESAYEGIPHVKSTYDKLNKDGNLEIIKLNRFATALRETAEMLLKENTILLPDSITIISTSRDGKKTFTGGTESGDWGDATPKTQTTSNTTNTNAVKREVYYKTLARPEQTSFRTGLLNRYNSTCMITGCTTKAALEAAHIEPFAEGQDDSLKNGLLLRADLHLLFDKKFMAIDPETGKVHFKDVGEDYKDYEQKIVDISKVSREKLATRWKSFKE